MAFCQRHSILAGVETALGLIKKHFPSIQELTLRLSDDPETREQRLIFRVIAQCQIVEAVAGYEGFLDEWISVSDWQTRKRMGLSYNIA
jgi:hypothetical protein